jgi:hypothetical protein
VPDFVVELLPVIGSEVPDFVVELLPVIAKANFYDAIRFFPNL